MMASTTTPMMASHISPWRCGGSTTAWRRRRRAPPRPGARGVAEHPLAQPHRQGAGLLEPAADGGEARSPGTRGGGQAGGPVKKAPRAIRRAKASIARAPSMRKWMAMSKAAAAAGRGSTSAGPRPGRSGAPPHDDQHQHHAEGDVEGGAHQRRPPPQREQHPGDQEHEATTAARPRGVECLEAGLGLGERVGLEQHDARMGHLAHRQPVDDGEPAEASWCWTLVTSGLRSSTTSPLVTVIPFLPLPLSRARAVCA